VPVITSKLKNGSLTLGGGTGQGAPTQITASCQTTAVKLVPDYDVEQGVETLCGDREPDATVERWELQLTAIQDWSDPAGLTEWLFTNAGKVVPYEWKPTGATGPTYAGTCQVFASEIGGEVGARLTADLTFPCMEKPTITPAGAPADAG
jgi:hypothetical protein